jgi:ATPase subunit of ABC transporter with duplicated ATPase domains
LVSHDRDFVAPLAGQLLEIQDRRITPLVSNYEEYLSKKVLETREKLKRTLKMDSAKPTLAAATHRLDSTPKVSNNQRRAWESEIKKVETEISRLEQRIFELNESIATQDHASAPDQLRAWIEEQSKTQTLLDQKLLRWEELGVLLG